MAEIKATAMSLQVRMVAASVRQLMGLTQEKLKKAIDDSKTEGTVSEETRKILEQSCKELLAHAGHIRVLLNALPGPQHNGDIDVQDASAFVLEEKKS